MSPALRIASLGALAALAGCSPSSPPPPPEVSAAPSAAAAPSGSAAAAHPSEIDALVVAELRRDAAAVPAASQQSRDVLVRRAAARALARIGGEAARPGLVRALADEDDQVLGWAAYGLGFSCKGHEKDNVSALVARALGIGPPPSTPSAAASRFDAWSALARAVGRCGAETSEPTLVAWLGAPRERAVAAALALGDLGMAKAKLREETLAALLNLAAGSASAPPVPEALFAVARLENVPKSVVDRLREVATARLSEASEARLFAVRALGRAGEGAAPDLARVLATPASFSAAERAEAARALKRLGKPGQRALLAALPALTPSADPVALTGLVGDDLGVLLAVLDVIDPAVAATAKKPLTALASLPLPPSAPATIARRLSWIRCGAARALAGADEREPLLLACDVTSASPAPDGGAPAAAGSIGQRALVDVLGRGPITGSRMTAYRAIALGGELRAREAALDLIEAHDEIDGAPALLAEALTAKQGGLVATAADVLGKQPQRAGEPAVKAKAKAGKKPKKDEAEPAPTALAPSPAIVKAILDALGSPAAASDPELLDSLVEATGALSLKEAKARLDELCRSPYPTTRGHAEKALALITGEKKTCDPQPFADPPKELATRVTAPATLSFDTDIGALSMTLDPALGPAVVTRVVEIARAGYYDGMVVHRIVPGYVTQFGAPFGDGFGGPPDRPALPCETTPLPFIPQAVGIALSGRDTGSSQLFVMHSRAPHLDGNYAIVGTATGPWASFVDGDLIRHVTVK